MILTTSRKPGRKTRLLAKVLSRYMNWWYISRGKKSIKDVFSLSEEGVAILEEIKGNPAFLKIYMGGEEVFSLGFNPGKIKKIEMDDSPVVFVGKVWFDPTVLGAIPSNKAGKKFTKKFEIAKKVLVRRKNGRIFMDFNYKDDTVFRLYVRGMDDERKR